MSNILFILLDLTRFDAQLSILCLSLYAEKDIIVILTAIQTFVRLLAKRESLVR